MKNIVATHRREAVKVDAYDEVSIVCHESRELVVDRLIVELQLIELRELKVEIVVGIAI